MSNNKFLKVFAFCVVAILLCFTTQLRSEPSGGSSGISEPIGKVDPFETVTPISDVKKSVSQRIASLNNTTEIEAAPELHVETVMLKFLKASNVQSVISNLISGSGAIATDADTNSLVICDTRDKLDKIMAEIKKADKTPKQIMIEVVIVDVQLNDDTEIGVNWTHLFDDSHGLTYLQTYTPAIAEGGLLGITQNNIRVSLQALQKTRNVEILASPRIMVVSGQEAEIKTIEEIAYRETSQTSEGGSMVSTSFKEAGVTLKVKATITDENKVMLVVEPEQSVNTGINTVENSDVPTVDKRSAKTTLLMNDSEVMVLGGLRKKETRVTNDKVPLLGDLPLLGFLFSDDRTETKNSELLVFISPHIYDDGEQLTDDEREKYDMMKNLPPLKFKKSTRPEWETAKKWLDFSDSK